MTITQVADLTGIPSETVRKAVRSLVHDEVLAQHGGRGRTTTYTATPEWHVNGAQMG